MALKCKKSPKNCIVLCCITKCWCYWHLTLTDMLPLSNKNNRNSWIYFEELNHISQNKATWFNFFMTLNVIHTNDESPSCQMTSASRRNYPSRDKALWRCSKLKPQTCVVLWLIVLEKKLTWLAHLGASQLAHAIEFSAMACMAGFECGYRNFAEGYTVPDGNQLPVFPFSNIFT